MGAKTFLSVGARVLLGTAGVTNPGDWWHAVVLWTDGEDILVRQGGIGELQPHNAVHPVAMVRATGDMAFLQELRARAAKEVRDLRIASDEAERAFHAARAAIWRRLEEIGVAELGVEPVAEKAARRRRAARQRIGLGEAA